MSKGNNANCLPPATVNWLSSNLFIRYIMQDFQFIKNQFLSLQISFNEAYLVEYINLVLNSIEISKDVGGETHHILPKKLFPEFSNLSKFSWNSKRISYADHYNCHKLLYLALPGNISAHRAFWAMSNQLINGRKYIIDSDAYAKAKCEYREQIIARNKLYSGDNSPSKGNTYSKGYKHTEEAKKKISDKTIGRVSCIDLTINKVVNVSRQEYLENDKYVSQSKNTMTMRNKESGKSKRFLLSEINDDLKKEWEYVTCGEHKFTIESKEKFINGCCEKVVVFDKIENKNVKISSDIYYSNRHRYQTTPERDDVKKKISEAAKGKITCYDLKLDIMTKVSREEFNSDKAIRYFGTRSKQAQEYRARKI